MGEGGGGEEKGRFLSFTSLPFSLPFFPFSPETPDTQAIECSISRHTHATDRHTDNKEVREFPIMVHKCQVHALYSNKFCTT